MAFPPSRASALILVIAACAASTTAGAQWVTVALRFATALLNHPKEAHAEEAVHLARRVMWESTNGQGAGAAKDLEKQAREHKNK